jgi:quinoprotein glucose dehydrogenase
MHHRGDNLFANCLVALKAETGERLWHFREIRHDIWDLDIGPPALGHGDAGRPEYDAVAQVTKIGNTLLLDRVSGKPVFPFRLRRAPASTLEGERTAGGNPTSSFRSRSRVRCSRATTSPTSPSGRGRTCWTRSPADFGWFAPFQGQPAAGLPTGCTAARSGGAAFDPASGWLYVSANELPWVVKIAREAAPAAHAAAHGETRRICNTAPDATRPDRDGVGMGPPLLRCWPAARPAGDRHAEPREGLDAGDSGPGGEDEGAARFSVQSRPPADRG